MKDSQFDRLARERFGSVLEHSGFSCSKSRYCCFYREVSDDLVHLILPDLGSGGTWYDVKVFATSPRIEPEFSAKFPDDLGIPSGSFCYLHPVSGVGPDQKRYHCKTEDGFARGFDGEVRSALVEKAIPFLNRIQTFSDLIPLIKNDLYLGIALVQSGDRDKGRSLLMKEAGRLSSVEDKTGRVAVLLGFVKSLLDK